MRLVASNYEVNIKLNTRTINKQLNNLEKRISKLNKLAQGGRANRTVLRNEQEKIKKTGQRLGIENKILKRKQDQVKVDRQALEVEKKRFNLQNKPRGGGGSGRAAGSGGGSGVLSSAVISGAFPLLFGQGPLVGAAGALGGGLGAAFGGQMGGFAGGLAATSIVTPIQAFALETGKLGAALNDATKDVEAVSAALGITGTEFEKNLKTLQKLGDEEAAFEAARQKMINLVGKEGVDALQRFGKGTTELANQFTIAMTQIRAAFASFLQGTGAGSFLLNRMTAANLQRQAQTSTDPRVVEARKLVEALEGGFFTRSKEEKALIQANPGITLDQAKKAVEEAQKLANKKEEQAAIDKLIDNIQKQRVKNISNEIALLEKSFGMTSDEFEIEKQIMQMKEDGALKDEEAIRNKLKDLQVLQEQRKVADEVAASFERMANTIKTDIGNGIKGLIKGTQSLNEALSNVLDRMADAFLNMAIFGNAAGSSVTGGLLGSIFRANGGPVKGGGSYIVGEKGPELFTPGVSGMVTPNHALGGSTNVVVNVDASGSSVEGDDQSAARLGEAIASAVQAEIVNQKMSGGLLS